MSRVQEGLEPWIFENGDRETDTEFLDATPEPEKPDDYGFDEPDDTSEESTDEKENEKPSKIDLFKNEFDELMSKTPVTERRVDPSRYWEICLLLKQMIMRLVAIKKLRRNADDPSKKHRVQPIVNRFYGGQFDRVHYDEKHHRMVITEAMRRYNVFCTQIDLDQSDQDELVYILTNPKSSDKFTRHIKKHRDEGHPPFPLDELAERDFKFYHPAWYGKKEDSSI